MGNEKKELKQGNNIMEYTMKKPSTIKGIANVKMDAFYKNRSLRRRLTRNTGRSEVRMNNSINNAIEASPYVSGQQLANSLRKVQEMFMEANNISKNDLRLKKMYEVYDSEK